MANPITFSDSGRGLPIALSRPAGALPYSPFVWQAYAPHPLARLGWAQGVIRVGEVILEPPSCALSPSDSLGVAAQRMLDDESGYVPICEEGRLVGVVYLDAVLECVAGNATPPNLTTVLSTQIPTCAPRSELVDAVREMIACHIRKIPVVGDACELLGMLSLCEAAANALRDPSVADVLERFAESPSRFARRMR